jgi:hypothetical protein
MKNKHKVFLAGLATIALIAGTGLASAQESKGHGPTPQAAQPHAAAPAKPGGGTIGNQAQPNRMGKTQGVEHSQSAQSQNPQQGKMGVTQHGRQEQNAKGMDHPGPSTAHNRMIPNREGKGQRAEDVNRTNKVDRGDRALQGEQRGRAAAVNVQNRGLKGLQGNASGFNGTLTDEQRTQIRSRVIEARGAPRVGHVGFDVAVGTAIPRGHIHVAPVPPYLVQIDPAWSGFLYFVYEDEVVIVNPQDMRIVAVLPA